MRQPLIYSLLLHLVVFTIAYFGVVAPDPDLLLEETPVAIDIVTVAENTNVPSARTNPEPMAKPMSKSEAERTPPPQPPVRPEARPPEPAPESEVAKLVPPKAKPTPVARPEKAEKPTPKAKPSPKPVRVEPEPRAEPEQKPKPNENQAPPNTFDSVLKTVEQLKSQPPKAAEKTDGEKSESALESQVAKALSNSATPFDEGLPVTMSEIESVRRQIERCWNLPAGAKDAENLTVSIRVEMNIDGTPRTAVVTDQGRMRVDPFYRAAAESAVRAVLNPRCHPFTLPREKFKRWKTMTLVFNPKEMFGT
jgi:outer membrane biosynthesis protein TonB